MNIIDFIFVNEAVTPLTYRVITEGIDGRLPSDHYLLYADVVLTPRG
jgi:endonuclease/exonuclease/phosphatase family metal-dependent hydrolase